MHDKPHFYILDSQHRPVSVDLELWSRWFSVDSVRVVKQEKRRGFPCLNCFPRAGS
jgi:hypothetical protein